MSRTPSKAISKAITENQFGVLVSALEMVLPASMPADVALHQFFRNHPEMGMQDRAFVAEGVYALLRRVELIKVLAPQTSARRMALATLYRVLGRDICMSTGKKLKVHHLVAHETGETVTDAGRFKTLYVGDEGEQAPSRFELWLPEDRRYPPVRMRVTERGHQWEQRMLRVEME